MAKITKRSKTIRANITRGKLYPVDQAIGLIQQGATAKFRESVDVAINLGIDAKKSDQNVRGSTVLPHGTGKSVRVAVFAQGVNADKAKAAGADVSASRTSRPRSRAAASTSTWSSPRRTRCASSVSSARCSVPAA